MKGMSSFGVWLKTELDEAGMTQKELAKILGITEAAMSRYIHGGRSPRGTMLLKIMDYFGVHIVYEKDGKPVCQQKAKRIYHPKSRLFECSVCGDVVSGIDSYCRWCGRKFVKDVTDDA